MNQLVTRGIVLTRTDYGEADRILTVLTPDQGKLRLMARGVRKARSKLAGGIELFSVSDLSFIRGRGEIGTLTSSRLRRHYGRIVADIDRVQLGYELIKRIHRATEDEPEAEYFDLLEQTFGTLDEPGISLDLIRFWFEASLLRQAGYTPNLRTDTIGQPLEPTQAYNFDFDAMAFVPHPQGAFTAGHIKTLRLLFSLEPPLRIANVQGLDQALGEVSPLLRTMTQTYLPN